MGKAVVTTWDMGPVSLAAVGDVTQMQREFRAWLLTAQLGRRKVIDAETRSKRDETDDEVLWRAARRFCREQGYGRHVEDAIMPDPVTGKPQNPNGVKRVRRIDVVERYHKRGRVTRRQLTAAQQLRDAWERTQRSAPALQKVKVDVSSAPDRNIAIIVDRISRYHAIANRVEKRHWGIVSHVVLDNLPLGALPDIRGGRALEAAHLALREALDFLADALDG